MAKKKKAPAIAEFDHETFGQILTPPMALYPHDGKNGLPWPDTPDPLGSGEAVIAFLNNFKIAEGKARGKPLGDNLAPHVRAAIMTIFGWRDPLTWTRYTRSIMFTAPRKSQKTFLAAIIAIAFLYSTQEQNNSIIGTATASRQSRRLLEMVIAILKTNPALADQCRIQDYAATITNQKTGTTFVATPADPAKLYGLSPGVILADELHAWKGPKGQKLWNSLITGQGARANPLWAILSTVPDDPPAASDIYSEQVQYAQKVSAGEITDPRHVCMTWIAPEDADIENRDVWRTVNPGLGTSLTMDELEEAYERAKTSEAGMVGFRAMRLNQIPRSSLEKGWLSPKMLAKLRTDDVTIEYIADCEIRALGVDMGGSHDLLSISAVGQDFDGTTYIFSQSYAAQSLVEEFSNQIPINDWVSRGEIVIAGDGAVPTDVVVADILDLCDALDLTEIALDPAYTINLAQALEPSGIELRAARQGGMSMAPVVADMTEVISSDNMVIGTNSLIAQAFANTAVLQNSVGSRLVKVGADDARNPAKMDPVAATATAWQLILEGKLGEGSAYRQSRDDVILVCPWTDTINATAVEEGGSAAYFSMGMPVIDNETQGWLLQGRSA